MKRIDIIRQFDSGKMTDFLIGHTMSILRDFQNGVLHDDWETELVEWLEGEEEK